MWGSVLGRVAVAVARPFRRSYVFDPRKSSGFVFTGPKFVALLVLWRLGSKFDHAPHAEGLCWESDGCGVCARY